MMKTTVEIKEGITALEDNRKALNPGEENKSFAPANTNFTWTGVIIFLISMIMVIYSLISFFVGAAVSGWASTLCSIWALGGLQLLAIGIIGEYIGKIYLETKHRPRFIVEKYLDD